MTADPYARADRQGRPSPHGWDDIPGARGCTPQACAFRDRFPRFRVPVAVLSAQPLDDQLELAARNRMPFSVVADPELRLGAALRLPTFEVEGSRLYMRLTLVAHSRDASARVSDTGACPAERRGFQGKSHSRRDVDTLLRSCLTPGHVG